MAAISIDVGLVAYVVTQSPNVAVPLGIACALVFITLWILVPQWRRRRR